jgi:hypothetical protein
MGLVLRQDENPAQSGMQTVAEGEVDDAVAPPNGTAGLARSAVKGCSRDPTPPARMMPIVFSGMSDSKHCPQRR